ncbi:predicted protein [Aspergillus terreus NIH2624]|uniref:Uncharacterized protein n=1 Tax=Aspergillus terreus (strain NIH 2624 / FGSC A1156) TaxID=341663 RepID=Q0CZL6_ASPTN|nr:uncharacterized protein ATEG_00868 [Aspergillus terreus NIH2624]EAU39514.1 predicted protein [Aspergillus terreus NIH2624]
MCSQYFYKYDCGCTHPEGDVVYCAKRGTSCTGVRQQVRRREGYNCPLHGVPSTSRSDPVEHYLLVVLFFRRGARVRRWIDFDVERSVGGFRLFALNLGRLDPSELI